MKVSVVIHIFKENLKQRLPIQGWCATTSVALAIDSASLVSTFGTFDREMRA